MYSGYYGSAPTIQQFTIQLFTIQKTIVLLFTIQEWTNFTPGRVYNCIVPYVVLHQPFNNPLLTKTSWQGYIMYSEYCILVLIIQLLTVQEYVIQKLVIFTPGKVILYKGMLYTIIFISLLAGLYKNTLLVL